MINLILGRTHSKETDDNQSSFPLSSSITILRSRSAAQAGVNCLEEVPKLNMAQQGVFLAVALNSM